MSEKSVNKDEVQPQMASIEPSTSLGKGQLTEGDAAVHGFYEEAVSERYLLKSELVAEHLNNIGMGK